VTDRLPRPPHGRVDAEAYDQAQQAVLGQGVQNVYYNAAEGARPRAAPNTLVPPPALVGRSEELERLRQARRQAQEAGQPVVLSAVHGMGGAGKTALARALADEVAEDFPDARIEVDLLGFTPGHQPRDPEDVLDELLALAGFDPAEVPPNAQAKAGVWRSWLARRRVLLILDNAHDAAQIRPLLPGTRTSEGCLVVVTSRNRLTELDAAARVGVNTLPVEDAVALLVRVAGRSQKEMRATDAELTELARLCGRLPLALRSAGSLLARLSAAELIEVMRNAERPLEHLDDADQAAQSAFAASHQELTPALQEALQICAWHPGPDFDADSLAALTGGSRPLVAVHLARLLQRNLLIGLPHGRYTFHDLFLGYAREKIGYNPDSRAVRTARHRLYKHLSAMARTARRALTQQPADPEHGPFSAPAQAHAWLTNSTDELITAVLAALNEYWPQAHPFASDVAFWLSLDGKVGQAVGIFTAMYAVTEKDGDRLGQAMALNGLGSAARLQGDYERAFDFNKRALRLYRKTGDRLGQAEVLIGLGETARAQGDYKRAVRLNKRALALYRKTGDRPGQAEVFMGLGETAREQGDHKRAVEYHEQSLAFYLEVGDRLGQANALHRLGDTTRLLGDHERAVEHQERALALCREIGHPLGQANALLRLAQMAEQDGRNEAASRAYRSAARLYTEIGFIDWADLCIAADESLGAPEERPG
jgi:tetratricopeptide (TPR) repeat protein